MKPIIAIVGRTNVGKSTLFNQLTRTRDALVANVPGLTRDRIYGTGQTDGRAYVVVDTGGLVDEKEGIAGLVGLQTLQAARDADGILFLLDGREGLNPADEAIARQLRELQKPIQVAVNKTEGLDPDTTVAEFFSLGLGTPLPISSAHGQGLHTLMDTLLDAMPSPPTEEGTEHEEAGIKIAVVGRPNVGKSTLVNRLLGEERVLVYDEPGTTRDSIAIPFERDQKHYTLIDTAGVRRRARVPEGIEKFSVIKTLQSIDAAHVVILVIDASEAVTEQDASLLGMVLASGRGLVIAVNKWDGLEPEHKQIIRDQVDRRLHFVDFARIHYISALHGSGVGNLFKSIDEAHASAFVEVSAGALTRILEAAVEANAPPLVGGRRIKMRYAHLGGHNPPRILIHGNQVDSVRAAYRRYLQKYFREALRLTGTPLVIEFKQGENPFEGKKNPLTPRQASKRRRLVRHAKKRA
jgi:GTP-binding protein